MVATFGRNWFLAKLDPTGELLGVFAIYQIVLTGVSTFFLFGGAPVLGTYLPKLQDAREKGGFVKAYVSIIGFTGAIGIAAVYLFSAPTILLPAGAAEWFPPLLVALLIPAIMIPELSQFLLTGLLEFHYAALARNMLTILLCVIAAAAYFGVPVYLVEHPTAVITVAAWGVAITIGTMAWKRAQPVLDFSSAYELPSGFWPFSIRIHGLTVLTFFWLSVDQLYVARYLGVGELGIYYQFLSLALFLRFFPELVGRMLISSFSSLKSAGRIDAAKRIYTAVADVSVGLILVQALLLVMFSQEIASIFGPEFEQRHVLLIWIVVVINISALGNVNSTVAVAFERTGAFLCVNSLMVVVHLFATVAFGAAFGMAGVVIAKGAATAVAQGGLFYISGKLISGRFTPGAPYITSQLLVLSAATYSTVWPTVGIAPRMAMTVAIAGLFLLLSRERLLASARYALGASGRSSYIDATT